MLCHVDACYSVLTEEPSNNCVQMQLNLWQLIFQLQKIILKLKRDLLEEIKKWEEGECTFHCYPKSSEMCNGSKAFQ